MAHFAQIDENNIVVNVLVIPDEEESRGEDFIVKDLGIPGRWIQTSFSGKIRKVFAGIGSTYDEELDAFIPKQSVPGWIFDEDSWSWIAPIDVPQDGKQYYWSEITNNWETLENI